MSAEQKHILSQFLENTPCSEDARKRYAERIDQGKYTRDENLTSHFCVYFLPYDPTTGRVFLVLHKKADIWITAGGHMDEGELPLETLEREVFEELGVKGARPNPAEPFYLTLTECYNADKYGCVWHFDIWYAVPVNPAEMNVDPIEFHDTRWFTLGEACELLTYQDYPNALETFANLVL